MLKNLLNDYCHKDMMFLKYCHIWLIFDDFLIDIHFLKIFPHSWKYSKEAYARIYLGLSALCAIFFFVFDIPSPDVKDTNVYIGEILIGKEVKDPDQPTLPAKVLSGNLFIETRFFDGDDLILG